jgi:7,8-dihydropterin-6-yl-methyl-4-(beta-D-ribofuranosyl)aminobenzene 5'-phosphate synthase
MIDIHKIRISTLCDNGASHTAFIAEWGLSLHLCYENETDVLLDTGKGMSCVPNATALGIDLGRVATICLSHGHGDHTGGLLPVLKTIVQTNPNRKDVGVYCHPAALEEQYVSHGDGYFYCGIPYHLEELRRYGANFRTSSKPVWINDDMVLSGEIPLQTDFEAPSERCYLKIDGKFRPSPVQDDQALFVRTSQGLLVLSGCAHRGIINTLLHAREITGQEEIHMVVGGTHLLNTSMHQQERTADMLLDLGVHKVGVSHCTGHKPACYLAQRLGLERFFFNNAGTVITFSGPDVAVKAFEK